MPDRNEKGHFAPGNSLGVRFGQGQPTDAPGAGRPKSLTSSVKEHWNMLGAVGTDGKAKFSVADLERIVKAPRSDKTIPTAKRIAAREVLDGLKSGQVGRKVMEFLFDRTEGKARQQIDVNANVFEQKVIVLEGFSYLQSLSHDAREQALADGPKAITGPPTLPSSPMPLGGIEALLAPEPVVVNPITTPPPPLPTQGEPEVVEKASEPIDTRPAPRVLPSSPGRVHGPGESEG